MTTRRTACLLPLLVLPACGDARRYQFIVPTPEAVWIYRCDTQSGEVWFARAQPIGSGEARVAEWRLLVRQ